MAIHVHARLPILQAASNCEILQNCHDARFKDLLSRWTDIDLKTPAAIVLPQSELDCVQTMRWALQFAVPFVVKSGGHSGWSTIGEEGIIIDLSHYTGVHVDVDTKTATLSGGVLSKEVAVHLAQAGLFTALGNGNTVGAIPYFLGGGHSITSSITGFGSDQIISARMVSAKGEVVVVTEEAYPDLLWAIRGAGQFLGLITQLTVRAYPLSILRNNGSIWAGTFIFPLDRALEVANVMKDVMDNSQHATAGLMIVGAPSPARNHSVVISARYTGQENPRIPFAALYDLQLAVVTGGDVPIQNASDARASLGAKGGFKNFGLAGLHGFNVEAFMQTIDVWKQLVSNCPDAINTVFNFQWDSRPVRSAKTESAMSQHNIRYWQNNILWHTDAHSRQKVDEYNNMCIAIVRAADQGEYVDFQNGTREGPINYRYQGHARLEKLKQVKREWDAEGVFTKQLLD
ncbi:hypothetical protein BDV06DRAFT_233829 [Aspergillus oleicola]